MRSSGLILIGVRRSVTVNTPELRVLVLPTVYAFRPAYRLSGDASVSWSVTRSETVDYLPWFRPISHQRGADCSYTSLQIPGRTILPSLAAQRNSRIYGFLLTRRSADGFGTVCPALKE